MVIRLLCLCLVSILALLSSSANSLAFTSPALAVNSSCSPAIEFTYVPPYGSFDNLRGRVACAEPTGFKILVYINVFGSWWTKPYWNNPATILQPDGTWVCDITTGGVDQKATRIAAYLVPNAYIPPLMGGGQSLPPELAANAVASITVQRDRTLEFSGYMWKVKTADTPVGPGPNYFSHREEDVWVDQGGRLHLKIASRNGHWYATEVISAESFGYGRYTFTLGSRVDQLDRNTVLGLFTWDDNAPEYDYREIDIEFSSWGEVGGDNAQFVVQPWDIPGNRHRFKMGLSQNYSTHRFHWRPGSIDFLSFQGREFPPSTGDQIETWFYTGPDVPPVGAGNARINLWLLNGNPPADGQEVEVIIESFEFIPTPTSNLYLPLIRYQQMVVFPLE